MSLKITYDEIISDNIDISTEDPHVITTTISRYHRLYRQGVLDASKQRRKELEIFHDLQMNNELNRKNTKPSHTKKKKCSPLPPGQTTLDDVIMN